MARPLPAVVPVLQDVEADLAVRVDVAVVDRCRERYLRRLERVIRGNVNVQVKDAARVGRLVRTMEVPLPVEEVVADRARGTVRRRVAAEVLRG